MCTSTNYQKLCKLTTVALLLTVSVSAASVVSDNQNLQQAPAGNLAFLDSPALRIISDDDQATMQQIKQHILKDYSDFKSIDEVHAFLDKVAQLVHKHPKNVAFAQGDLKELLKFLSQESVTRLIRVDATPFVMPMNSDDRLVMAQRAVDEDDLTRKLFGAPLRRLVEARKQQLSRAEDGNHKDGNFFSNFWCKLSGSCSNQ